MAYICWTKPKNKTKKEKEVIHLYYVWFLMKAEESVDVCVAFVEERKAHLVKEGNLLPESISMKDMGFVGRWRVVKIFDHHASPFCDMILAIDKCATTLAVLTAMRNFAEQCVVAGLSLVENSPKR